MRIIRTKLIATAIISTTLFAACSKNVSSSTPPSGETISGTVDATGNTTLIIKPNIRNGQDAYVNDDLDNPSSVNGNFNSIPELSATSWTVGGEPATVRFFIRFDSLVKIPATAHIVSATLQLFSMPGSSGSTPQGNSVYPGSPYVSSGYPDNAVLIQRVLKPWQQSTITWATQPETTATEQDTIPTSNSQWNYDPKVDVTNLVKKMVLHPTKNFGFGFKQANENIYRSMVFASCEEGVLALRPKLTVVYN